jgi:hypothetical protein
MKYFTDVQKRDCHVGISIQYLSFTAIFIRHGSDIIIIVTITTTAVGLQIITSSWLEHLCASDISISATLHTLNFPFYTAVKEILFQSLLVHVT